MRRKLIMLIPGLTRVTRSAQLSVFVSGMVAASERVPLTEISDPSTPPGVRRFRANTAGSHREFDVIEAYWNDLVPSLSQESLKTRFIRGFSLLWFWMTNPRILKGIVRRKYLTFGLSMSALALILWYLGTIVLFVEAIELEESSPFSALVAEMKSFVNTIGGWKIWALASALAMLIPVSLLVDISDFAKRYIANEPSDPGQPAVRFEIIKHVREQLESRLNASDYSSLTVVGHSFGSVVTVDLFADLPPIGIPVRILTMGSLLEILGKQAPWLQDEVAALSQRSDLAEWVDINSRSDWFASGADMPNAANCRQVTISSYGTFPDKLAARVHARYFDNQEAVNLLLEDIAAAESSESPHIQIPQPAASNS